MERLLQETGGDLSYPTRHDVQAYIYQLVEEGRKPATIDRIYSTICVWARFLGIPLIVEKIDKPKKSSIKHIRPKSLDRKKRNLFLHDLERDGDLRNIAIGYLLLFGGLRVDECVSLNRFDVLS
ncbi:hypothetical protein [Ammoniphilus sp. 3BR4]|uniref:hypothetical protein n=1 Tax=Ammoniphilus sp. 3BR4 TaxID=3158265 RepID=UPI003464FA0E